MARRDKCWCVMSSLDLAVGLVLALALLVLHHAALLVEPSWSMAPSR